MRGVGEWSTVSEAAELSSKIRTKRYSLKASIGYWWEGG